MWLPFYFLAVLLLSWNAYLLPHWPFMKKQGHPWLSFCLSAFSKRLITDCKLTLLVYRICTRCPLFLSFVVQGVLHLFHSNSFISPRSLPIWLGHLFCCGEAWNERPFAGYANASNPSLPSLFDSNHWTDDFSHLTNGLNPDSSSLSDWVAYTVYADIWSTVLAQIIFKEACALVCGSTVALIVFSLHHC